MISYLLLIKGSFQDWNARSESQRNQTISEFGDFAKKLVHLGYMRGGDGCSERSFRIKNLSSSNEECLVPIETQDMVTGYFLIEVPSEEEALKISRECPAFNCGEYIELIPCGHEL